MAYCADLTQTNTYDATVGALCGRAMAYAVSIMIVLYCYGAGLSYLVVVGDESDRSWFLYLYVLCWQFFDKFLTSFRALTCVIHLVHEWTKSKLKQLCDPSSSCGFSVYG